MTFGKKNDDAPCLLAPAIRRWNEPDSKSVQPSAPRPPDRPSPAAGRTPVQAHYRRCHQPRRLLLHSRGLHPTLGDIEASTLQFHGNIFSDRSGDENLGGLLNHPG